jgi:aminoglycoside 2''-phosphotransferase
MNRQGIYLQSIHQMYPNFRIASVEINDKGQNNDVLVVNGRFIFRFPKYLPVIEWLRIETTVLTGIQDYVTLEIPTPKFINLEAQEVGRAFVGYRMIPGEPLWRETFQAIRDAEVLDGLAMQLAGFLKALHNVPVDRAIDCELPVSDTYGECADIYTRIREKLFTSMRPDAREWTTRHFETFLSRASSFTYEPVLKHGDFGPSNILFHKPTQTIRGIIDFGGSSLGDPAYDFAGLLSGYGESFVKRCCRTYPEVESFLDRTRFYQGTFALIEALFGVENDDEAAFESGIEEYV